MSAKAAAAAGVIAGGTALSVLMGLAIWAGAQGTNSPLADAGWGSGSLNTTAVPLPELVPWVLRGGQVCSGVTAPLIAAQIQQESGWNPQAVSPAGAEGIAQFMPGTWPTWARDDDGSGNASPFNPRDAIMAQARYDCALYAQVSNYITNGQASGDPVSLTLAAYNAGPAAVQHYDGVPPYHETRAYVSKVMAELRAHP